MRTYATKPLVIIILKVGARGVNISVSNKENPRGNQNKLRDDSEIRKKTTRSAFPRPDCDQALSYTHAQLTVASRRTGKTSVKPFDSFDGMKTLSLRRIEDFIIWNELGTFNHTY
ncbi:hypothetical protein FRC02_002198 [Tulasnella sp. 418]|nr:hypothetical protein FRC02_002198 [Tulasnella sp. 418]